MFLGIISWTSKAEGAEFGKAFTQNKAGFYF
jgi:hypothetical protein